MGLVRFVADKSGPERAAKNREYAVMRIRVGQKEQDPRVRFVADKSGPERPTKNGEYDVLRLRVGQQPHPPGSTNC